MTNKQKIEQIPEGVVVNRAWLKDMNINRPLVDYYLRSGYLERVARGVYRRPGDPLKWQHLVYSLQVLGSMVHVGGRTALELKGRAHYLPLGEKERIHLYCTEKLPKWLFKINLPTEFVEHNKKLFKYGNTDTGINTILFGSWDWKINISSPERAIIEMISDIPNEESFSMVDLIMEGAANLRPDLVTSLLVKCKNIKTKRLFLWFAEKYNYHWFNLLNLNNVKLGKGKRVIQKDGKMDPKYLITVPVNNDDQEEQSIF